MARQPVKKAAPRKAPATRKAATLPPPARRSALHDVLRQGRFGATAAGVGVRLSLVQSSSMVTVIARKGKAKALSEKLKTLVGAEFPEPGRSAAGRGLRLDWSGAEQCYAIARDLPEGALFDKLKVGTEGLASVSDQSHGRVMLSISGPKAAAVLAKGTPVDLHPREFGPGQCAVTNMAHVGVHFTQVGPEAYELSIFRGFAQSFWEWLTEMSEEFGYEVL